MSDRRCPNCGAFGGEHFVPPSLGEKGFYICVKKCEHPMLTFAEKGWICHECKASFESPYIFDHGKYKYGITAFRIAEPKP